MGNSSETCYLITPSEIRIKIREEKAGVPSQDDLSPKKILPNLSETYRFFNRLKSCPSIKR